MEYYPRAGERHNVNGIEITGYQLKFAMRMHGNGRKYWVDVDGRHSFTYESLSKDRRLVDALTRKGLAEVRTETYDRKLTWGPEPRNAIPTEREVFTLLPGLVEFIEGWNEAERKRETERHRAMNERHERENAERDARTRERKAREIAVEALIRNHPIAFEDHLAAAYRTLDSESI